MRKGGRVKIRFVSQNPECKTCPLISASSPHRTLATLAAVLLSCGILSAQTPSGGTIRVKVDLVTIETAVLNKSGKPVPGLKIENFRLLEDGKEQQILTLDTANCRAPAAASPENPASLGGKIVLLLFDDSTLGPAEIKTVRDAAEIYVNRHMGPADWFAVAVFWRNLQISQNFTRDSGKVLAAIRRPASSADTSPGSLTGRAGARGDLNLLRSLIDVVSSLERTPGRKAVLLFTNDFFSPSQDHYSHLVEGARKADVSFFTLIARRASARGSTASPASRLETKEGYPVAERPPESRGFQRSAPGAFLLPAAFLSSLVASPQQQTLPKVIPQDPYNPPGRSNTGDASRAGQYNDSATGDCLRGLAEATGGDIVQESSDLVVALDAFEEELCQYYLLGFQSSNPRRDGRMRKIEVKISLKGVRLKYRPGYFDARPIDQIAGGKSEAALLEAISSPEIAAKAPFTFQAYYFYEAPDSVRVPIYARIPRGVLNVSRKTARSESGASVMGAAFSEDGRIAARFSQVIEASPHSSQAGSSGEEFITFNSHLRLRPGTYRLRLAVSDDHGTIGASEETLTIPVWQSEDWAVGSLVVSQNIEPLPEIVRTMQSQLLDERNPFLFRGHQILISGNNSFLRQQPLLLLYRINNLTAEQLSHPLIANIRLRDETGVSHLLQPIRLNKVIQPVASGIVAVGFSLTLADRPPGRYQLAIDTVDESTRRSVTCQTAIELRD